MGWFPFANTGSTPVAWYNVRNFGATGNGTTDDAGAIQAALTAASGAGHGVVYLPSGTYLISQTLQVGSNTTLRGDGYEATVIKAQNSFAATQVGANPGMVMICTTGNSAASRIRIADLALNMNEQNIATVPGYATAAECSPIGIQNVTSLTIERVEVINAIGYSIFPVSCTDVRISGCRVLSGQSSSGYANQDGIHVTDCTAVRIAECWIDTGTTAGVGDDAIAIQGVSTGTADVAITGNVIEHAAAHGISLVLGGSTVTGVAISGNVIKNTINEGLLFFFTTFVASATYLITDVAITGNTFTNIATGGTGSGITLQDAFGGTGGHVGTAGYAGVTISGNLFDTCTTTGFGIYAQAGSDLTISNNTLRKWGSTRGINIGDNSSATSRTVTNAQVNGNVVDMSGTTETTPVGIAVIDSPDTVITGNTSVGPGTGVAGGIGIWVDAISTAVTGCVVGSNRARAWAAGITEANGGAAPDYNIFVGNDLHGNTAFLTTVGTHTVIGGTNANVVA